MEALTRKGSHPSQRMATLLVNTTGVSAGHNVEVAGIEPASDDEKPGLLRVQSADDFLGPHPPADRKMDGLSQLRVPAVTLTMTTSSGSLDDAGY